MLDVLGVFKRNINQFFWICVDILNVGRSLQQLPLSMQILAFNRVAQAAKVGDGNSRPMLALVEILNHTPQEIRPEVEAIDVGLAKLDPTGPYTETRHDLSATWLHLSGRHGRQITRLARHP